MIADLLWSVFWDVAFFFGGWGLLMFLAWAIWDLVRLGARSVEANEN